MSSLSLHHLTKYYGRTLAVADLTLQAAEGEMIVLLGPAGSGKTTTVRMIAGFVAATSGDILLDGRSITALPPHQRDIGVVFQNGALFPHLSVAGNVAFGLERRRLRRVAVQERVTQMLRLTRLEKFATGRPRDLSASQQQRLALARALAIQPRLLLLDEPMSGLDPALRRDVGRDIRLLQRERGLTTLMVTHDQTEAMALADRLVVMRDGRVHQIGTQSDLYEHPATPFVAGFIGGSNMLPGVLVGDDTIVADGARFALAGRYGGRGPCTLSLRPELLSLRPPDAPGVRPGSVSGIVELASHLGALREHLVRVGPELRLLVRQPTGHGGTQFPAGSPATIRWDARAELVFGATDRPLANQRMEGQRTEGPRTEGRILRAGLS